MRECENQRESFELKRSGVGRIKANTGKFIEMVLSLNFFHRIERMTKNNEQRNCKKEFFGKNIFRL